MKLIRILIIFLLSVLLLVVLTVLHFHMSDFRPKPDILMASSVRPDTLQTEKVYHVFNWNIGYAGLNHEMDFFYDGGTRVRPAKQTVENSYNVIQRLILDNDSCHFLFLQEVDRISKRSWFTNQVLLLRKALAGRYLFFAKNYDVSFVPVPFGDPMGRVVSGLLSSTLPKPSEVRRIVLPGRYSWPVRLFMLDRCLLVKSFPVSNGKTLLLVHTHNEAYDEGDIRMAQLLFIRDLVLSEFQSGNYVLVGGDWNQCPPGFTPHFNDQPFDTVNLSYIPDGFMPDGWHWVYDATVPTNRRVIEPYQKGATPVTLIDYFLFSPNIEIVDVKGVDLGFEHSDHNPVLATFRLN